MLLKELLTLVDYNSRLIIYVQDVKFFPQDNDLHLLYIEEDRDKNIKGIDDMIDLYGSRDVRRVRTKDDYLEIFIYIDKEEV